MRGYVCEMMCDGDGERSGKESESRDSRHGHTATPIASLA